MSSQSTSPMPGLPSMEDGMRIQLRRGQKDLLDHLIKNKSNHKLNIKWPGGYGKSLGMALTYKVWKHQSKANRLLVVVGNDTQRRQIQNDFLQDCHDVGLIPVGKPWVFNKEPITQKMAMSGKVEIFVTTIQTVSSTNRSDIDTLSQLLRSGGNWMLCADEYHHYGEGNDWGESLKRLVDLSSCVLAMSATPDRDNVPTIFGPPDLEISYRDAVEEQAVKVLATKRYHYMVDGINKDNEIVTYSTDELRELTGQAENVDKFMVKRELRSSEKYVYPIVSEPLTRLISRRDVTGLPLQMLVRAMSCKHAERLMDQIKSLINGGGISIDWMGTGEYGRSDEENQRVREAFCPKKDRHGKRPRPSLDILVQVGMADEGFDSINVAEVIDLSLVSLEGASNKTKQFYKRGSRWIQGLPDKEQICFVNVPSDHPLSGIGENVMEWVDSAKLLKEVIKHDQADNEYSGPDIDSIPPISPNLPDKRMVTNVELRNITSDNLHFRQFVKRANEASQAHNKTPWDLSNQEDVDHALEFYKIVAAAAAKPQLDQNYLFDAREDVDKAIGSLARLAVIVKSQGGSFERSLLGDMKKRVNSHFKKKYGDRNSLDVEELHVIKIECAEIDALIRDGELPLWLR